MFHYEFQCALIKLNSFFVEQKWDFRENIENKIRELLWLYSSGIYCNILSNMFANKKWQSYSTHINDKNELLPLLSCRFTGKMVLR